MVSKIPHCKYQKRGNEDVKELEGRGIWLRRSLGGGELIRHGFADSSSRSQGSEKERAMELKDGDR